jgi:hypothetical protein
VTLTFDAMKLVVVTSRNPGWIWVHLTCFDISTWKWLHGHLGARMCHAWAAYAVLECMLVVLLCTGSAYAYRVAQLLGDA